MISQPQGLVGIDWGNPLSKDLTTAVNGAYRNSYASYQSNILISRGRTFLNRTSLTNIVLNNLAIGSLHTIVIGITDYSSSDLNGRFFESGGFGSPSGGGYDLEFTASSPDRFSFLVWPNGSTPSSAIAVIDPSADKYNSIALTLDKTNTTYNAYHQGFLVGSNTTAILPNVVRPLYIGQAETTGANRATFGFQYLFTFDRVLSPDEIMSLNNNPWQLFKEPSRLPPLSYALNPKGSSGTVTLDFDTGRNETSNQVLESGILSGALCEAYVMADTNSYHSTQDHTYLPILMSLTCGDVVPGVGFTVTARSLEKLTGRFVVRYVWVNP